LTCCVFKRKDTVEKYLYDSCLDDRIIACNSVKKRSLLSNAPASEPLPKLSQQFFFPTWVRKQLLRKTSSATPSSLSSRQANQPTQHRVPACVPVARMVPTTQKTHVERLGCFIQIEPVQDSGKIETPCIGRFEDDDELSRTVSIFLPTRLERVLSLPP